MTTVIIPKDFAGNNDLVAVPKRAYAEFLAWQKKTKSAQTFKPSTGDLKELANARKDFANGKVITLDQLKHELGSSRSNNLCF